MSNKAMSWASDLDGLTMSQKITLVMLADQANDDGFCCWPSRATLARRTCQSERNVTRAISQLKKLGLVTTKYRSTQSGRRGSMYFLNVGATIEGSEESLQSNQRDTVSLCENDEPYKYSNPSESLETQLGDTVSPSEFGSSLRDTDVSLLGDTSVPLPIKRTPIVNPQTKPDLTEVSPEASGPVSVRSGLGSDFYENVSAVTPPAASSVCTAGSPPSAAREAVSERELALLGQCLPESMQSLDPAGARDVAALLEVRVEAGWKPSEIRRALDQPLPAHVGRLSRIVGYRIEKNVDPQASPAAMATIAERVRAQAAQERSEALAVQSEHTATDPRFSELWESVRAEMPDAGRVAQALEVDRRLALLDSGVRREA